MYVHSYAVTYAVTYILLTLCPVANLSVISLLLTFRLLLAILTVGYFVVCRFIRKHVSFLECDLVAREAERQSTTTAHIVIVFFLCLRGTVVTYFLRFIWDKRTVSNLVHHLPVVKFRGGHCNFKLGAE